MARTLKDLDRRVSAAEMQAGLLAYRAATDHSARASAGEELLALLYAFVNQNLGVTYGRASEDGGPTSEKVGQAVLRRGIVDPEQAHTLAGKVIVDLMSEAEVSGELLREWNPGKGASLGTYLIGKGVLVARDLGIDRLTQTVGLMLDFDRKNVAGVRQLLGLGPGEPNERTRDIARELATKLMEARKAGGSAAVEAIKVKLPSGMTKPLSTFEEPAELSGDPPKPVPTGLRTPDSPFASALRVTGLVHRLRVLGDEMNGASLLLKAADVKKDEHKSKDKTIKLGVNHRNLWNAYLALTPEAHEELDQALEDLAETRGWSQSKAKQYLAECFAYVLAHPKLEEILELWVPSTLSKHASPEYSKELRESVRKAMERDRSNLRKLLQAWIARYLA